MLNILNLSIFPSFFLLYWFIDLLYFTQIDRKPPSMQVLPQLHTVWKFNAKNDYILPDPKTWQVKFNVVSSYPHYTTHATTYATSYYRLLGDKIDLTQVSSWNNYFSVHDISHKNWRNITSPWVKNYLQQERLFSVSFSPRCHALKKNSGSFLWQVNVVSR